MAEFASAIIGITAVGLQVCKSLMEYYDSFKDQDRSIARTIQDAHLLCELLDHVKLIVRSPKNDNALSRIDTTIGHVVAGCHLAIEELEAELGKIRASKVEKGSTISDHFAHRVRRIKYPFKESTLMKLRESMSDVRDNLNLAFDIRQTISLDVLSRNVDDLRRTVQALGESHARSEAQRWLDAVDPWSELYTISKKRHRDTGLWLLQSNTPSNLRYRKWKHDPDSAFLWLTGFAGTGKSVLVSSIIRDIAQNLEPRSALVFYFFNFQDPTKQSSTKLLRSLVQQLSGQSTTELLEQFHQDHQNQQPSSDALLEILSSLMDEFARTYIVVDAVDECPAGNTRDSVLEILNRIKIIPKVHFLVSSREEIDILQSLQPTSEESVSLQNPDVQKDIELFIRDRLSKNRKMSKWQSKQDEIESALIGQAQGMFRWVECQFMQLERCRTLNSLKACLRSLPTSLNETYDRILYRIDQDNEADVLRALSFLCFSLRPVTACELIDAMAVRPGNTQSFDPGDRIEDLDDLLNMLPGLLSLTPWREGEYIPGHGVVKQDWAATEKQKYHKIHFAHASVKDYFLSGSMAHDLKRFHVRKAQAHEAMAQHSLSYLLATSASYQCLQRTDRPLDVYPFSRYAIEELSEHLKRCDAREELLKDIIELYRSDGFVMEVVQHKKLEDFSPTGNTKDAKSRQYLNCSMVSPAVLRADLSSRQVDLLCAAIFLTHACVTDLARIVINELTTGLKNNGFDDRYVDDVLLWLLAQVSSLDDIESETMCSALLSEHSRTPREGDLLHQAMLCRHAYWGDLATLGALLPEDSDARSKLMMNPINTVELQEQLYAKWQSPATKRVMLFLQYIISSPMCCALQSQKWDVVQYFLDNGCIDWCKTNLEGQLALDIAMCAAATAGNAELVKVLLSVGANARYKDELGTGFTALHRATLKSELQIMRILLEHGADINARTRFGTTPLHFACRKLDPEVTKLLLSQGADVTVTNTLGLTGLHSAALRASADNIKLLLAAGADPLKRNSVGATPRQLCLIHMKKWTELRGFQKRGPAALQALEEGETQWNTRIAEAESNNARRHNVSNSLVDLKDAEFTAADGQESLQVSPKLEVDDVVDIFIEVPQILSSRVSSID